MYNLQLYSRGIRSVQIETKFWHCVVDYLDLWMLQAGIESNINLRCSVKGIYRNSWMRENIDVGQKFDQCRRRGGRGRGRSEE